MSQRVALYQSLSACGATLIAFIGFCHEVAGHIIFPWGPDFLGGPIGWHGTGLLAIVVGLLLVAGTLRVIKFPVVPVALVVVAVGIFFVGVAAFLYGDFHAFALAGSIAAATTAFFHREVDGLLVEERGT